MLSPACMLVLQICPLQYSDLLVDSANGSETANNLYANRIPTLNLPSVLHTVTELNHRRA